MIRLICILLSITSDVTAKVSLKPKSKSSRKSADDAYQLLAQSIQNRLNTPINYESKPTKYSINTISSALRSLSTTQSALKKIDGTAHEMYQRTHKSSTSLDEDSDDDEEEGEGDGKVGGLKVKGRMSRNAARVGCLADALFAAELCELINVAPPAIDASNDDDADNKDDTLYGDDSTLADWTGRKVVLNTTIHSDDLSISVLVIYESDYNGGAGIRHGGVDDLLSYAKEEIEEEEGEDDTSTYTQKARGRYLVILSDHDKSSGTTSSCDLPSIISILDKPPLQLRLNNSRIRDNNSASVCEPLYNMSIKLLKTLRPIITISEKLQEKGYSDDDDEESDQSTEEITDNDEAIHFVGYSLAGGVAAISANILEGALPLQQKRSSKKQQSKYDSLYGCGRGRTSAICLGAPPCISSNVENPFITSVITGDDIVCRTTHKSINHLCNRLHKNIKGGVLGKSVGWMSEAVSLTVSGLKTDKHKEEKLAVPGNVYLVRPRRIGGGSSSIHEVGGNGKESSLRANVLWQLNDVLLSKSLWSHHKLATYIRSLDKVKLKGFADETEE